jgi:hypothetical protein
MMELSATHFIFFLLHDSQNRPITHIEKNPMGDINFEANQTFFLQETEAGSRAKQGHNLANAISTPNRESLTDANFTANPCLLKSTDKGSVIRKGKEISRPISLPL